MTDRLAYSVKEAAEALGVSEWKVREEIYRKRIFAVNLGRRLIIPRWALEDLLSRDQFRVGCKLRPILNQCVVRTTSASLLRTDAHTIVVRRIKRQMREQRYAHHLDVAVTPRVGRSAGRVRGARRSPVGEAGHNPGPHRRQVGAHLAAALVDPNGYMGARARIYQCEGHRALSRQEDRKKNDSGSRYRRGQRQPGRFGL